MGKINIEELLRDCPKGMELDCTVYDNIIFESVNDWVYPISVKTKDGSKRLNLTKYGCTSENENAKCIIFPKGKTTWNDFVPPCKFKDGDILTYTSNYINTFIYRNKDNEQNFSTSFYVACNNAPSHNFLIYNKHTLIALNGNCDVRLATEEEKQKLFDAIKANGYEWNPKSKTLEKLSESKEDTDDRIVMSGIYFDRENYADEVELHLNNYEIEIRDGKTYAVFKNTLERLIEPKFKVGDKIKHKNTVLTIISVRTNSYLVEDEPNNFGILMISQQDKWELINEPKFKVGDRIKKKGLDNVYAIEITAVTPRIYTFRSGNFQYVEVIDKDYELVSRKFDISTLKPFNKVLVRDTKEQVWVADLFSHMVNRPLGGYTFACVGHYPSQCIPYEGNEHLLGTTNDCDEYFNLIS